MEAPPFPSIHPDEANRLAALHAARLLDTDPEEMFDRITRLAARVMNVPIALISLLDKDRQWFKSRHGLDVAGTSRDISFCGHAILSDGLLVIPDTLNDPRFSDNPMVTGAPFIRFYAGMAIRSINGMKIGTLCLIDHAPRTISREDEETIRDLALTVEELIRQRQLALSAQKLLHLLPDSIPPSEALASGRTELEDILMRDALTGLSNRAALLGRLAQHAKGQSGTGNSAVIAFLDLDHFKTLNEALGHAVGDQVLVRVAKRLVRNAGSNHAVARTGGDEFALLIDTVDERQSPQSLLQEIAAHIAEPIQIGTQSISVACSIGFSRFPDDGTDADSLFNTAYAALRDAKESGRRRVNGYTSELSTQSRSRLTMETALRGAVERDELLLHYQPKVDLASGSVVGVEALVRWHHPELGMVSPAQFIPLAEKTGLIVPIGEWVLQTACRQSASWNAQGLASIPVAVNLSSRQLLGDDIVAKVAQALRCSGLPAELLELELTESVSMDDPERSAQLMRRLREMGVSLSIDDFGTGYSSLSYLKRLPIDKIKIDRSFVLDMTENEEALAIVQAIIAMAHRLRLKVVAEGVETEKQLSFLSLNRCDQMQGYYFSKPLSAADCAALLSSGRRLAVDEQSRRVVDALFGCR